MLAFMSDDLSSSTAEAYSFLCNVVWNDKNKHKEGGILTYKLPIFKDKFYLHFAKVSIPRQGKNIFLLKCRDKT